MQAYFNFAKWQNQEILLIYLAAKARISVNASQLGSDQPYIAIAVPSHDDHKQYTVRETVDTAQSKQVCLFVCLFVFYPTHSSAYMMMMTMSNIV